MNKSQTSNNPQQKKDPPLKTNDELFEKDHVEKDEIESDGSASAFDGTESVNEDNFDDLSEK
jgi:hypothetical protein